MDLQLQLTGCCLSCLLLKTGGWGRHGLMALFFGLLLFGLIFVKIFYFFVEEITLCLQRTEMRETVFCGPGAKLVPLIRSCS